KRSPLNSGGVAGVPHIGSSRTEARVLKAVRTQSASVIRHQTGLDLSFPTSNRLLLYTPLPLWRQVFNLPVPQSCSRRGCSCLPGTSRDGQPLHGVCESTNPIP